MPRKAWPLAALLLGLPVWWVLGLASFAPIALAVPMALHLVRTRPVRLPSGFGWWVLFLAWLLMGVLVLWADAPGAVSGGGGGSRLLVFGFRVSWYVAATIAMLWVVNLDRRQVPDRAIWSMVAAVFGIAAAGGLLGYFAPTLEFRSAIEWVLPAGIRSNAYVFATVHPQAADIQEVLGDPSPRPKAPFAYTNTWGSCIALTSVFLVAWAWKARLRGRLLTAGVLVAASVPIAYSLNRGLWAGLALAAGGGLMLFALRKGPGPAVAAIAAAAVAAGLVWSSPLGDLARERLEHQHSNERRGMLLSETVESVSTGSPVVGFGSTRDVQGSFASIAGGSTPDCPACGVPPLGTQGQLWLVLFSQGWLGLAFFLIFFVLALVRCLGCRTANETICLFVVGIFLLQLSIYDTLGIPLLVVMIAIGLVARERLDAASTSVRGATATAYTREVRRGLPVLTALAVAGAGIGAGVVHLTSEPGYAGQVAVAVTPAPVYLDIGDEEAAEQIARRRTQDITLDTEVALLLSNRAVGKVRERTGLDQDHLRSMVGVTAVPNSHVLEINTVARGAAEAEEVASRFAAAYLSERRSYLDQRRSHLLLRLEEQFRELDGPAPSESEARLQLASSITRLGFSRPEIGTVVRRERAVRTRPQWEVGLAGGAGVGLLVGLVALNLSRDGSGRVTLRQLRGHDG